MFDVEKIKLPLHLGGLLSASPAFAISLIKKSFSDNPCVLVCPTQEDAEKFHSNLTFFFSFYNLPPPYFFSLRQSALEHYKIEDAALSHERLGALFQMHFSKNSVLVTSFPALAQKIIPKKTFVDHCGYIENKTTYNQDTFVQQLIFSGYISESTTQTPGSFSRRGSLVDVFSPHLKTPVRIEFFGDDVESIRSFDPQTQKSIQELHSFYFTPASEIILNDKNLELTKERIKEVCDARNIPPAKRLALTELLDQNIVLQSHHKLLPLFFQTNETLFFHTPENTLFFEIDPIKMNQEVKRFASVLETQNIETQDIVLESAAFFENPKKILEQLRLQKKGELSDTPFSQNASAINLTVHDHSELRTQLHFSRKKENPLEPLFQKITHLESLGTTMVFVSPAQKEVSRIEQLLNHHGKKTNIVTDATSLSSEGIHLIEGTLDQGFDDVHQNISFFSDAELFGKKKKTFKETSSVSPLQNLQELNIGDPIVHTDFGVGIFQGLKHLSLNQVEGDFILLEYAQGDKLFLPVYRLNKIHKFIGNGGAPTVDRLGNQATWEKTKQKAQKAVEEMAQELIKLYAKRKVATQKPFSKIGDAYLAFEADFPFEETRDQLKTLDDVSADLESDIPMDRLVCGDVGFGKTEIALRAAFRTVHEGKQVAVLVPTTILCQQHHETFRKRFENFAVKIDFLSRFKSTQEQKRIVDAFNKGELDIVVGTHRLLSQDVSPKNLGLLILDEEHRFGVKHKELIKQYKNQVHVLTLTATPIPRTLQLSMTGIRDLSVINTPPLDRKAVQTYLCERDDQLIQNAIRKELARKGQVYFLHNRVDTMDAMLLTLKTLVPEARILPAHGQMSETELEKRMLAFIHKEVDVLLSTTIIESGLDIPSANTMIINRADTFGLAQLYQLRGRVGRSDRSAYCYLLIPGEDMITRDALKRLKVLQKFSELGSGLNIALEDLEIRGAGNLLGASQSGFISNVGFELYTQLLEREIRRQKGEQIQTEIDPEIQTHLSAFLPESYCPSPSERVVLYRRLSNAQTSTELAELKNELIDRFGALPIQAQNLIEVIGLKIIAKKARVKSLKITPTKPIIEFGDHATINVDVLLRMIQKNKFLKLTPDQKLTLEIESQNDAIQETQKLLESLLLEP